MIRAIAAIDDRLGLATDTGIPWNVPADVAHFRAMTASSNVLMGYATYAEFDRPMPERINYVATRRVEALRTGFMAVDDVVSFLSTGLVGDIWIIGGAAVYASTLPFIQELSLTRVQGDFGCTKFFPPFETSFRLTAEAVPPAADGVPAVRFQTWQRDLGLSKSEEAEDRSSSS
ncbi:MAG: dihydrofolate reductase [Acidimicrobiales bacterium]|nr:dihydrofolate reductase [Acidimicrobiales bacterium]